MDGRLRLAAGTAIVVVVLDQLSKAIVAAGMTLHETIPLLPFFSLTYVRNRGAAFGILSSAPAALRLPLFLVVTAAALWILGSTLRTTPAERRLVLVALGGIVGGAVGNLICRLRFGEVIDFFHLHWGEWSWPMFNVADSAITLGVGVVLLESFRTAERTVSGHRPR